MENKIQKMVLHLRWKQRVHVHYVQTSMIFSDLENKFEIEEADRIVFTLKKLD